MLHGHTSRPSMGTVTFQLPHWPIVACAGMSSTTLHQRRRKRKSGGSSEKRKGSQGYPATLVWTRRAAAPVGHTTFTCGRIGGLFVLSPLPLCSSVPMTLRGDISELPITLRLGSSGSVVPPARTLSPHLIPQPLSPPRTTCSDGISLARGSWHHWWLSFIVIRISFALRTRFLFMGFSYVLFHQLGGLQTWLRSV